MWLSAGGGGRTRPAISGRTHLSKRPDGAQVKIGFHLGERPGQVSTGTVTLSPAPATLRRPPCIPLRDRDFGALEVSLDTVDQRLLTIERVVLPGDEQPSE